MDKTKILIIDDEKVYADILRQNLQVTGKYICSIETDSTIAIDTIKKTKPDLVILELMLPKVSGYWICNHLKKHESTAAIPIIVVSGKDDEADKV